MIKFFNAIRRTSLVSQLCFVDKSEAPLISAFVTRTDSRFPKVLQMRLLGPKTLVSGRKDRAQFPVERTEVAALVPKGFLGNLPIGGKEIFVWSPGQQRYTLTLKISNYTLQLVSFPV
jgi:hypothetical protein